MSESTTNDIVLEKDAFKEDTVLDETPKAPDSLVGSQADHVEIGNHLDHIEIDPVVAHIAKTNQLDISWEKLQRILDALINKQCTVMEDKVKDEENKKAVEVLSTSISHAINEHSNCPFTIQRLCELIIEPKKYYKMYIKYLRAVDKVLSVTSYWEDYACSGTTANQEQQQQQDKIEVPLLLPSFSIELEPHNFEEPKEEEKKEPVEEEQEIVVKGEATEEDSSMEDVSKNEQVVEEQSIKDEQVKEKQPSNEEDAMDTQVTKEENVMEDASKDKADLGAATSTTTTEEASNDSNSNKSSNDNNAKMDLD